MSELFERGDRVTVVHAGARLMGREGRVVDVHADCVRVELDADGGRFDGFALAFTEDELERVPA